MLALVRCFICLDSLEILKPEDAQNVRKRLFEFAILTHSQKNLIHLSVFYIVMLS